LRTLGDVSGKQCAAVRTWPGEINVPPQNPIFLINCTWKGYCSGNKGRKLMQKRYKKL